MDAKITEITDSSGDMLISIHIGSYDSSVSKAIMKIPASNPKSSKLACVMSNILKESFNSAIIQSIDFSNDQDADLNVLKDNKDSPVMSIEIGNIKNSDFMRSPNSIADAAAAIIEGIEEYYSPKKEGQ